MGDRRPTGPKHRHDAESFLARHAAVAREEVPARATGRKDWYWTFDLPIAPERLWPHVSDTSRFNRALGLGRMEFEEIDGRLEGRGSVGGFLHEWTEEPWEWVAPRTLSSVRHYRRGLFRTVRAIFELEPVDDGCVFHVYFGWEPRNGLGRLALRIGEARMRRRYGAVLDEIVRAAAEPVTSPLIHETDDAARVRSRLGRFRDTLAEASGFAELSARLLDWIAESDPIDAYRIQVLRLAREWDENSTDLIRVALHATRLGVLELRWDTICPHCRGLRSELRDLVELPERDVCGVCEIEFGTDESTAVEVTFRVHPSVRSVPQVFYCSAEPARKAHIALQLNLAASERRAITTELEPGRYRVTASGGEEPSWLVVDDSAEGSIECRADPLPEELRVAPFGRIEFRGRDDARTLVRVEKPDWRDDALRAGTLFSIQTFRDLYSEQFLASGVRLSVGEQTILFTDVVGSSRFYEQVGDAEAFARVREHFVRIGQLVGKNEGAVVKTIGDAALAAFTDPADAQRAAERIQEAFADPEGLRVRVSAHIGPCIAVRLSAGIDYFGSTVNQASKLQRYARAGEIVVSDVLHERLGRPAAFALHESSGDELQGRAVYVRAARPFDRPEDVKAELPAPKPEEDRARR